MELRQLGIALRDDFVFTENIEAVTQLILTDLCIGFIPHHYAAPWEKSGMLLPILAHKIVRYSDIKVAWLRDDGHRRPAVELFLNNLIKSSPAVQVTLPLRSSSVSAANNLRLSQV